MPSSDNPIAETSSTTSCTKPSPPVPSHTKPSPLLSSETVLPTPLPVAFALGPASMPHTTLPHCPTDASPLPLNPRLIPPHPSLNRHMCHSHQLLHSLQSFPSSQHPQRLPSLGYPSIPLLLVKLVKHFCWMLPSYLQWPCHIYLTLGGGKGTKLRIRLTRNGIIGS
jgi:hypothetical protein